MSDSDYTYHDASPKLPASPGFGILISDSQNHQMQSVLFQDSVSEPDCHINAIWAPMTITVEEGSYFVPKPFSLSSKTVDKKETKLNDINMKEFVVSIEGDTFEPVGGQKTLLQPFTGSFEPNTLTAILGPSGAGKSTFLDMIANKLPVKQIGGILKVNGLPISRDIGRKCFGYVWQDDHLHENLTIVETLQFVYRLRFAQQSKDAQTYKSERSRIDDVLEELGLQSCADTRVGGSSFRGISGGERRRLCIAIELLANPSVLLLDEPTTSLDSSTALQLVATLKNLACRNRTIICTIHQPQSAIYALFDQIFLLATRGRTVYFGNGFDAVEYFAQAGYPCDLLTNPSDHFLDLVNDFGSKQQSVAQGQSETELRVKSLVRMYASSQLKQSNVARIQSLLNKFDGLESKSPVQTLKDDMSQLDTYVSKQAMTLAVHKQYGLDKVGLSLSESKLASTTAGSSGFTKFLSWSRTLTTVLTPLTPFVGNDWMGQNCFGKLLNDATQVKEPFWLSKFYLLLIRTFVDQYRNKSATLFIILQTIVIGLIIGFSFKDTGAMYDQNSALNRRGVLYFVVYSPAITSMLNILLMFHGNDRQVFIREYASGLYSCSAYFLSKVVAEFPLQLLCPLILSALCYQITRLSQTWLQFWIFNAAVTFTYLIAQSWGMVIGVFSPSLLVANAMAPFFAGFLLATGGYLKNVNNIPVFVKPLFEGNFVKITYEIASINEFIGLNFTCPNTAEILGLKPPKLNRWQRFMWHLSRPLKIFEDSQTEVNKRFNEEISKQPSPCIFRNGTQIMKDVGFNKFATVDDPYGTIKVNLWILLAMLLALQVIAFLGLKYCVARKTRK